MPLFALFSVLTLAFAGIAIGSAIAGGLRGYVVGAAAALIALWMGSFGYSALQRVLRKRRR